MEQSRRSEPIAVYPRAPVSERIALTDPAAGTGPAVGAGPTEGAGPADDAGAPAEAGPLTVQVLLLGGFEVRVDGITLGVSHVAQRLVSYLALRRRGVSRTELSGVLWPEVDAERAAACLRSALWRARSCTGARLVHATTSWVTLADRVQVDYRHAEELTVRLSRDLPAGLDPGELTLLTSDLLPDWSEDWVATEREAFRQLRLHTLERVCAVLTEHGDYQGALTVGLAAVAGDPLRESAQRCVIAAHLAEGNLAEAARQYDRFERLLARELGVRPSAPLRSLAQSWRPG
ncbi:MAG TPA: BTAD domain-containing putative transcriptional regulator [Kineosporiaceae bacterium]|nr:BTAD domain-containing putative transcriptional regulator [Kineosporiaceae bacterium]